MAGGVVGDDCALNLIELHPSELLCQSFNERADSMAREPDIFVECVRALNVKDDSEITPELSGSVWWACEGRDCALSHVELHMDEIACEGHLERGNGILARARGVYAECVDVIIAGSI